MRVHSTAAVCCFYVGKHDCHISMCSQLATMSVIIPSHSQEMSHIGSTVYVASV